MASFGGQPIYMAGPEFGGQPIYTAGPEFGGQPKYTAGPEFGGQPKYMAGPEFGGQPVYMAGCFPKSEFVLITSEVNVRIGSLKIGDKISSWDVEHKKMQYTAVTNIHKYTVNDIMCFNSTMLVSSSHPFLVVEKSKNGVLMQKWKVAFDVNVGDCVVGAQGKLIAVKKKNRHWYNAGIEVLNLSTDGGVPFLVGNCVVRAENAKDFIEWADTPITQKLLAA